MPKGSQLKDSGKLGRGMMALPHFLAGGGEIGALMRAKSWSDTLLGAPEDLARGPEDGRQHLPELSLPHIAVVGS